MNRKSFISNIIALLAAPSVLAEIDETGVVNKVDHFKPRPLDRIKMCFYLKVPVCMFHNEDYMSYCINKELKYYNIVPDVYTDKVYNFDPSKPYNIEIGTEEDDFTRELKTVLITQYIDK